MLSQLKSQENTSQIWNKYFLASFRNTHKKTKVDLQIPYLQKKLIKLPPFQIPSFAQSYTHRNNIVLT